MASVDNIFAIITFFGLAIFFIALMIFWNVVYTEADDLWTGSSTATAVREDGQNLYETFDFILVLVYFGIHLGILVMAFLLRTHPVVYVGSILIVAILALVAAPISNAYEDFKDDTEVVTVTPDIPITNYILDQLPVFEIIWGFVTCIVMFGLARYEGIL